ncbi:MAG TPA: Mur ligase family protein [Candidatus Acidoferrales bacterium]|nr:Mur ligase family protein [Candidatus Acidoferrales bacterium]
MTSVLQRRLETLYGSERRRDKLDLDGTRALLGALGDPQTSFQAVHVAGTNGKGSVCALVERVLRAAGARTGLFTSPHLVDFRERFRERGRWPDEADLAARLERIEALPEAPGRTFFEIATALGFEWMASRGVEWAVVEVGLGGRLDTTNVLVPRVCAVTSIGLDHAEILGDSHEAIAAEKAGIFKAGVPAISGVEHDGAATVIARIAREVGAPLHQARELAEVGSAQYGPWGMRLAVRCEPWGAFQLQTSLRGSHQRENAVVALAVLAVLARQGRSIPLAALRAGFAEARWPGRLEPSPAVRRLWWDGAHNLDGVRRLAHAWREDMGMVPPVAIVFAVARDKDATGMLRRLGAFAPEAKLILTRTASERALSVEALAASARGLGLPHETAPDVRGALAPWLDHGADGRGRASGRVLLCGSLFAVGEAMEAFGGAPGALQ